MSIFLSIADAAWKHWRGVTLLALLVAAAILGQAWYAAHRSAAALSATLATWQQQIDAAATNEKARDAHLATQLAQIAALEKQVQTPQQAFAALPGALPPLPVPITFSSVPAALSSAAPAFTNSTSSGAGNQSPGASNSTAAHSGAAPTPTGAKSAAAPALPTEVAPVLAPLIANIPQQDLDPLYDYFENCQATTVGLDTAKKDLADEQTQVTALTKERDAVVSSAKGGGFWTRLRRGAKWFAIGAAAGAVAGGVAVAAHR
jgi:hypothetical protein